MIGKHVQQNYLYILQLVWLITITKNFFTNFVFQKTVFIFKKMFLTKILFITVFYLILTVNAQDYSKLNVKFSQNNWFKKGIYLPWIKVSLYRLQQIPLSYLVKQTYKTYKRTLKCNNVITSDRYYLCRAKMSNGVKILGYVSRK